MNILMLGYLCTGVMLCTGIFAFSSKSGKEKAKGKVKIILGITIGVIAIALQLVLSGVIGGRTVVASHCKSVKYDVIKSEGMTITASDEEGTFSFNRNMVDLEVIEVESADDEVVVYEEYRYEFMGVMDTECKVYLYITDTHKENI